MPKKTPVEPLIDLSDDPLKELKVNVRMSVLTLVNHYVEFYKSVKGGSPDKNRVVDQGLQRFFDEDKAFQNYMKSGSARRTATPSASATPSAGG
jgi:hypothetical protein